MRALAVGREAAGLGFHNHGPGVIDSPPSLKLRRAGAKPVEARRAKTGITVLTGWHKAHRLSHDNGWHVCVSFDEFNQPVVLCIFEPGSSSAAF